VQSPTTVSPLNAEPEPVEGERVDVGHDDVGLGVDRQPLGDLGTEPAAAADDDVHRPSCTAQRPPRRRRPSSASGAAAHRGPVS
jgi:hypothetical protein